MRTFYIGGRDFAGIQCQNLNTSWPSIRGGITKDVIIYPTSDMSASIAQKTGATTDPLVCARFSDQHQWTQNYVAGIKALGGEPRIIAVAPIAATHEKVLAGYAPGELVRGFVLAEAHVGFPQVAFIRGDCAAVIFDIREEGSDVSYTLGVRQMRAAVGRANLLETVAGMVDLPAGGGAGSFVLPANAVFANIQREVLEETGGALTLNPSTFINLSAWQHAKRTGLASSRPGDELTAASPLTAGGSDEKVHLFACCATLPRGSLKAINGARGGAEENESTLVQVLPMSEAIFAFADVKFLSAYTLLQAYKFDII